MADFCRLHPVFHVNKLSPWEGNEVNGLLLPPPELVEIDGEEEYKVEQILDLRMHGCQLQFLEIGRAHV